MITKKNVIVNNDPFAPVRLSRLQLGDRFTDKLCIEMQKEDSDEWDYLSGVDTTHSEDYRLVPNQDVHDMLDRVTQASGHAFRPLKTHEGSKVRPLLWDGRQYVERRYAPGVSIPTEHGSEVMLGIEARNSYNGKSAVRLAFFAMHLACENQFHSANLLGEPLKLRHIGADDEDSEMEQALLLLESAAESFSKIAPELRRLGTTPIDGIDDLLDIRRRLRDEVGVTFRDAQVFDELDRKKITSSVGLDVGSAYGEEWTLWALVNALTAVSTHFVGGIGAADQSARALDFLLQEARDRNGG